MARGQGDQSTCRPWSSVRVVCLVLSPSLEEHMVRGGGPANQRQLCLTLTWEHSSQGVHGKEEHFCDFQGISHGPIIVPKV